VTEQLRRGADPAEVAAPEGDAGKRDARVHAQ
jgi:hypothetical protein